LQHVVASSAPCLSVCASVALAELQHKLLCGSWTPHALGMVVDASGKIDKEHYLDNTNAPGHGGSPEQSMAGMFPSVLHA
jgi:hypothetical protein